MLRIRMAAREWREYNNRNIGIGVTSNLLFSIIGSEFKATSLFYSLYDHSIGYRCHYVMGWL